MIYFMQSPDGGLIKIGMTKTLSVRLRSLEYKHEQALTVLAVMPGDRAEERELHERFAHIRVTGEWFSPSEELTRFIADNGEEWDGVAHKPIRVDLSPDSHKLLRKLAADSEMSMTAYAKLHLGNLLEAEVVRRGIFTNSRLR